MLCFGVPGYKIKRLQRNHNIAARVVARPSHYHDIDEVLKQKRYGLRSNDLELFSVPSADFKSYDHRAFLYGAVVEWNKLPLDLKVNIIRNFANSVHFLISI